MMLIAAVFCAGVCAATAAERIPQPQGFVNDFAGVLSPGTKARLEALLNEVKEKTTAELAVVTVRTTGADTIEQYAVDLFEAWGIGKKGEDNGILVLLAAEDRKVRIEVGYGLEGTVTDLRSKLIIETLMIPAFKRGGYDQGLYSGAVALVKLIAEHYGAEIDLSGEEMKVSVPEKEGEASPLVSLLVFLFFLFIFGRWGPFFFLMSGGGTRHWSSGGGGSFGGGFGGFGGGSSGGGGASGSW